MALLYILVVLANVVCFVTGLSLELVAGNLTITQSVENVPGTLSGLSNTTGLWAESDGNLYIADSGNFKVRMLDSNGIIATTFGTGNQSDDGTDGTYRAVTFDGVHSVQVDRNYIFITSGNYFIWKYQPGKTGPVLRIAGATPATRGYGGDGGDPKLAILNQPMGLYVTTTNLLYFADYGNDRIRVINDDTNIITTVAGNGVAAFSGDGGPATSASLSKPTSVWMDNGYLYITDTGNNCIRMFDLSSNIIQTFLSGLNQPTNIVFDSAHTAYYSEPCRIMKYDGTTASLYIGSSSCGVQQGYERIATNDDISAPRGLAADVNGVLYFSEMNIIRKYSSLEAPSRTPTRTPSRSPTISSAPFPTTSPTLNSSPTRSPTLNSSPTRSPTLNSSPTHSPTLNSSPTHSPTLNSSPTRSPTLNSSPTRSPTLNSSPTRSPTLTSKPSSLSPSFRPSTSNMNSTSLSSSKSERLSDINIFYVTFFPAFFVLMILITFLICCYCYGAKFPNELYGKKDKKYEKVEKSGDHSATNVVDRQRFYELSF